MKFYEAGELRHELFGEEALEHCKKCPYCYENNDDNNTHDCIIGTENWNIEEELYFDDGQVECWKS